MRVALFTNHSLEICVLLSRQVSDCCLMQSEQICVCLHMVVSNIYNLCLFTYGSVQHI